MVKVKGQISELAICIVDSNDQLAGLSKAFFTELANKVKKLLNVYTLTDLKKNILTALFFTVWAKANLSLVKTVKFRVIIWTCH